MAILLNLVKSLYKLVIDTCLILVFSRESMPNLVIQQIKIADYKNTFLMPNTSNCRLQITNGPSDK